MYVAKRTLFTLSFSASKQYRLAMHTFGLMTHMASLKELNEAVLSAAVVFGSSHAGPSVETHFQNLQVLLTATSQPNMEETCIEEDFVVSSISDIFNSWPKSKLLWHMFYICLCFIEKICVTLGKTLTLTFLFTEWLGDHSVFGAFWNIDKSGKPWWSWNTQHLLLSRFHSKVA